MHFCHNYNIILQENDFGYKVYNCAKHNFNALKLCLKY